MVTTKKDSRKKICFPRETYKDKITIGTILSQLNLSSSQLFIYIAIISGKIQFTELLTGPHVNEFIKDLTFLGSPFELLKGSPLIYIEYKGYLELQITVPNIWRANGNVMRALKNKSLK